MVEQDMVFATTDALGKQKKSPPSAVQSFTLHDLTSTSVVVAWNAPANHKSSDITGYKISWLETETGRRWSSSAPHFPLSASPLTLSGLTPDSSYVVEVAAVNRHGTGAPTSRSFRTLAPPPPDQTAPTPMVGGYYPNWTAAPVRIRDVDPRYNLIYLFHAEPVGGPPGTTGAVFFNLPGDGRGAATHFVADLQYARTVQKRKIILTVGGANSSMSFPTRQKSQTFLNSIISIYDRLGGFDGLDWNTFEGGQAPDTAEMIWISQQLKQRYPGFIISAPPAPWNTVDMQFCAAMLQANALDYCAPQYYDGPGLDSPAYVSANIDQWVALLGQKHVAVGFGIADAPNYMTVNEALVTWQQVKYKHPSLRGAFNWQIHTDEAAGWGFAKTLGPLIAP